MVNIAWENPSMTNLDTSGRLTTQDFIIYSDQQELGCGEIKVNNASTRLEEEDRARLGERMKRQLHHRIKQAKSTREFHLFGILISDNAMELYRSTFTVDKGYEMFKLKKITLPTLEPTYTSTAESLELLFTFKTCIINSMQDLAEIEQPYIYRDYYKFMKPTVSFI